MQTETTIESVKRSETRNGNTRVTAQLTPKNKLVGKRVKRIKIWIDRKSYLTTKFEYVEPDGDLTRYEFTNIRVNQQIAPHVFELNLPPTVRVEQMKIE